MVKPFPTNEEFGDALHRVTKALASVVPTLPEVVDYALAPPLKTRQQKWFASVARELNRLAREVSQLKQEHQQEFLTAFIQVSKAAMETHDSEKHRILINALRNTVLTSGDFVKRYYFLRLLQEFQPLHVKVLDMFRHPNKLLEEFHRTEPSVRDLSVLAMKLAPELATVLVAVLRDLEGRSLLDPIRERFVEGVNVQVKGTLTDMGREFLDYVQAGSPGTEGER